MKKVYFILAALMLMSLFAGCSMVASEPAVEEAAEEDVPLYYYCTAEEVKSIIENGEEAVIVDIQPQEYFDKAHLPGSVFTGAYPADTDELRAKLDVAVDAINASPNAPVIIVGLGGKTGAENAAKYYAQLGIPAERLKVLEGGAVSWPYDELAWYTIEYQYITPDQYMKNIKDKTSMMVIDMRPEENYNAGFLPGSIPTNSHPNATAQQWEALDALIEDINKTLDPVVLISMTGQKDAQNAINHWASKGVDNRKFHILEGGGNAWPYPEELNHVPAFQYITADAMTAKLTAEEPMVILSVQSKDNYREVGHFEDSIATYAYPADTASLRSELGDVVDELKESADPIIVVSHRDDEGATNAITYYVNQHDMDETRFFILEGGIAAWPHPEMLELGR